MEPVDVLLWSVAVLVAVLVLAMTVLVCVTVVVESKRIVEEARRKRRGTTWSSREQG